MKEQHITTWEQMIGHFAKPYIQTGMDIKDAVIKARADYESYLNELHYGDTEHAKNFRQVASNRVWASIRKIKVEV